MNERNWSDLDRRLDDAIDALNDERAPEAASDDDDQALLDTLRVVRRLRGPGAADAGFEDRLVSQVIASASDTRLVSFPNGAGDLHYPGTTAPVRPSSRKYRLMLSQIAAVLRVVGVFVLSGMLSSAVVGGLGGRIVMRISGYLYERENPGVVVLTESSGEPVGQISLAGTINLVVESAFSGIAIGLLLLLVAPWLPRTRWRKAGAFSLIALAATGPLVINTDSRDMQLLGEPLLNIMMFAALIVSVGILTPTVFSWLNRVTDARGSVVSRTGAAALRGVATLLGGLGLVIVLSFIVSIGIFVTLSELLNPSLGSIVVVPLALAVAFGLPMSRIALAFPDRMAALDRLRSESSTRIVTIVMWFAVGAGLLTLSISMIRIVAG